ncbi:MFS transporter [Nonomuraea zeae]|uniref:MFS transporter n=1 Tax=Nonomuraea zeae TaxID=1642303 RepID=A0A5S4H416_9ACTN|nr:MFS transporter [Nonomuraea zeae]TMR39847.1 MFS transporter [Nonomuraea zeae]
MFGMIAPYLSLLRRPGVSLPFASAFVARLPLAMTPLGLVVLIEEVSGSYADAGLVTAVYALATAASSPLWGMVMDRAGQSVVIAGTSLGSAAFLTGGTLAAATGAPNLLLLVLIAGAGLSFPPIIPAIRVAWSVVVPQPEQRRTAYAMDAVAVETIFVLGPLLLTGLLWLPPAVPLLVTALLMAAGGLTYSRTRAARLSRPAGGTGREGARGRPPLTVPGVWLTLFTALGMSLGFGQMDVAMTASAERLFHSESLIGIFFACAAVGSTVGGLWYGSRTWTGPERRHLPLTLAAYATGLAAVMLALLPGGGLPALVFPALVVTGLCISPSLIVQQALVDHNTVPDRRSEAQGWLQTSLTSGAALGMAFAGVVVEQAGPQAAFGTAALAVAAAALAGTAAQRRWRRTGDGHDRAEAALPS